MWGMAGRLDENGFVLYEDSVPHGTSPTSWRVGEWSILLNNIRGMISDVQIRRMGYG